MSAMQAEAFGAFRAIDVPEDKALRAAASQLSDAAAVKHDMSAVKADVTDLKVGMTRVEGELALLKGMAGFGLAFLVAITLKLFLH